MKRGVLACFALSVVLALSQPTWGQVSERVIVPDVPGGSASVRGCYAADRTMYGPYQLSFCFDRPGTYKVRGGGVRCDGKLQWSTSGKYVKADLRRQSCNKGVAWAAGRLICRPRSGLDVLLDALSNQGDKTGSGRVIVSDPKVKVLKCTYDPSTPGEKSVVFFGRRL